MTRALLSVILAVLCGSTLSGCFLPLFLLSVEDDSCDNPDCGIPPSPRSIQEWLSLRDSVLVFSYDVTWIPGHESDTSRLRVAEHRTVDGGVTLQHDGIVVHDPGSSSLEVGAELCAWESTIRLYDVPGFDPLERQQMESTFSLDTCGTDLVGISMRSVIASLKKDARGTPLLVGTWTYTSDPSEPIPNGFWYEGGDIEPSYVCPEGATYGDPGCSATCFWTVDGRHDCPTLAEVLSNSIDG